MTSNEPTGTNGTSTDVTPEWITLGDGKFKLLPTEVTFDQTAGSAVIDDVLAATLCRNRNRHFEDDDASPTLQVTVNGHVVTASAWSVREEGDGYLCCVTLVIDSGIDEASKAIYAAMLKSLGFDPGVVDHVFVSLRSNRAAAQEVVVERMGRTENPVKSAMRAECLFERTL